MNSARELAPQIGILAACLGLGVARATFYRAQRPVSVPQANVPRASSPRALSVPEQHTILEGFSKLSCHTQSIASVAEY
jgi:putative transposase